MKRAFWVLVLVTIVSFALWSNNPIDDVVNFIIGGSIPGTNASLGFWPMMGIIVIMLLFIYKSVKNAQLRIIEDSTKHNRTEKAKQDFKEQNSGDITFDKKNRSVIAAPASETTI